MWLLKFLILIFLVAYFAAGFYILIGLTVLIFKITDKNRFRKLD